MSDTPDVLDVAFVERFATECMDPVVVGTLDGGFRHDPDIRGAERLLRKIVRGGYVLVKAPGLSHGDELAIGSTPELFDGEPLWVRRSVPERRCSTCDGRKVVEGQAWRRIDDTGFPARELVPCPACSVPENGDT